MKYITQDMQRGVARIFFNDPEEKMNTIKPEMMEEFRTVLDKLEGNSDVKALVLASGKPGCFIAGADINMFQNMPDSEESRARALEGHALLQRLADFRVPTIAAVVGVCMGGGLEVALACQYRIAGDDPKTVFSLPEVQLGLLPGLGGTQRLPRLVGLSASLDMLMSGKKIYAHKAKKMGLVDVLVQPYGLADQAVAFALEKVQKPGRKPVKKSFMNKFLDGPGKSIVYSQAAKRTLKMTAGNYPAPLKILDCVKAGLSGGMQKGIETEVQAFDELVRTDVSKNLVGLFFNMNRTKKNPMKDKVRPVKSIGVLGAGLMGAGIAEISAPKNYKVILKDISVDALSRGEKAIGKAYNKKVKRKIWTAFQRDGFTANIHGSTDYEDLSRCDMVIEAVFEDLNLKRKVLADVEAHAPAHCIFATNTSSIPIAQIAETAKRPEQVIGMHYFSPVSKMPLLEIIITDQTADWVVATAIEVGIKQGKNVVVVKDGPGFYTTRILGPMLNEAVLMLEEGAAIEDLDKAMFQFGFPVGPVTLMDEVGIDVGAKVGDVFSGMIGDRDIQPSSTMKKLYEAGYMGRKNKKGFYRYDSDKKGAKPVNTEVYRFLGGSNRKRFPFEEIQDRLAMAMVNEAAWCLHEGIIDNPSDGDIGAILGLGFPPFRGGPFRYMDAVGPDKILAKLDELTKACGTRFKPAPIIKEKVGGTFHQG